MQLQVERVCFTYFQQNFTAASLPSATLAVNFGAMRKHVVADVEISGP